MDPYCYPSSSPHFCPHPVSLTGWGYVADSSKTLFCASGKFPKRTSFIMAMHSELPSSHNMSQPRSRYRSKEFIYALLAGLLVLTFFFYSREGGGILPSTTPVVPQNGQPLPTGDKSPVVPTSPETDPLINEAGLEVISSPSGSTTTTTGSSTGGSNNNNGINTEVIDSSSGSTAVGVAPATPAAPVADRPVAVIIESNIIPNLIPLMLHFATVLGPAWGMILFTLQDGWVEPMSPAFQRFLGEGRIEVRFLPTDTKFTNSASVSRFLTSPWLWEQVIEAPRMLLFQSDSILCSKSEGRVDDYFEYDLVGAPIAAQYGQGYNGGLSIRNPRLFLNITQEVDFVASGHEFEDQFFYEELQKRGAALPSADVAKTFSVETIYYETPMGYHQPQRWQSAHMDEVEEWCPEVKMLIGRRAQ